MFALGIWNRWRQSKAMLMDWYFYRVGGNCQTERIMGHVRNDGLLARLRSRAVGRGLPMTPYENSTRPRRCPTKRTYPDWEIAEKEATLLLEDLRNGKLRIRKSGNVFAYCCSVCGRWHIGHT